MQRCEWHSQLRTLCNLGSTQLSCGPMCHVHGLCPRPLSKERSPASSILRGTILNATVSAGPKQQLESAVLKDIHGDRQAQSVTQFTPSPNFLAPPSPSPLLCGVFSNERDLFQLAGPKHVPCCSGLCLCVLNPTCIN